eukprot:TRINITY_DN112576_c0_g1_i1.p1 TRINITY_DN112576_c0_g1~~TRINITY_DN112576_c0_g1_i1.p1  ORF type:complete len:218 (+),score=32.14 TRINITY_DN112576_c0_g1_i1:86-739(+)
MGSTQRAVGCCLAALMLVATFNVFTASQPGRLEDVLTQLKACSIVLLQGTRLGARPGEETQLYQYWTVAGFHVFSFPYKSGGNKHSGVVIALAQNKFQAHNICQVWAPAEARYQGRIGAVRVKVGESVDITAVSMYLPPAFASGDTRKIFVGTLDKLCAFLDRTPSRSVPLVGADTNAKIEGPEPHTDWPLVGVYGETKQDAAGHKLRTRLNHEHHS